MDKKSFEEEIKYMHEDAQKQLMSSWEEAQQIPWFRRLQLMHDPQYLIQQLKQGRYLPSFCVERICRQVNILNDRNFEHLQGKRNFIRRTNSDGCTISNYCSRKHMRSNRFITQDIRA